VGTTVVNTAYYMFTPIGEPRDTIVSSHSYNLTVPTTLGTSYKTNSHSSLYPGEVGTYSIEGSVNGTEELNDFCVNDTIPPGIEVTQFDVGGWYYGGITGDQFRVDVYYTTNLNGPTLAPGSPYSIWDPNVFITTADLGLTSGVEYITSINWCFGDVPAGFTTYEEIEVQYSVMNTAPSGVVTNCSEFSTSTSGATLIDDCVDLTISSLTTGANLNPTKITRPNNVTFDKGDTLGFRIVISNDLGTADSLEDPTVYDLLPDGVTYFPGSWSLPAWGNIPGYPLPSFTFVSNYKDTGRDFLRWEWSGASGIKIPPGERVVIHFDTKIEDSALGGFPAFHNYAYVQTPSTYNCDEGIENPDVYDFDDDGDFTENLCGTIKEININEIVSLESEKLVKGQLDSTWTKYPNIGYTVPGGISDYQLIVRNKGNIQLDSIVVIDIFPFVGDQGVINSVARDSRWSPNLVGPVLAPAGVTVYYSTAGNPCRSVEGIVPSGPVSCIAPNWTTSPPTNITTVQSLKFDFGSTVLNPNDSLILEWPMRAPVNVFSTIGAQPDSIAWNSFGYIGQRADNGDYLLPSEPLKVGVSMSNEVPGVIGDFVWIDTNKDGIQDVGESGYDGMRVELFKDDGDANANPAIDTFINFTVTANGGFYLFPNLPQADYFLVFYKPAPFLISPLNIGGDDALDSDGTSLNYNSHIVAVTDVTNLLDTEYDFDWDLGVFPNDLSAIGNYVWSDDNSDDLQNESSSSGVNGVVVNLYDNNNPTTVFATDVTSNDFNGNPGYYLFDLIPPGDYFLEFVLPTSTSFVTQGATGSSDAFDSDVNTTTGRTEVFTIAANVYDDSWDAGLILSGVEVCDNGIDDDLDGLTDCLDPDCTVSATAIANGPICSGANLNLNENGGDASSWSWTGPNSFSASIQNPTIVAATTLASGNYTVTITNVNGCTATSTIAAVINSCLADIGDFVWIDENEDGIQTSGEPGIEGVTVSLYNSSNVLIATTTTDGNGAYLFSSISAGMYYLIFDVNTNIDGVTIYSGTTQNIGSPITDSDPNAATGRTSLFLFNTALGNINSLDAGYIISCPPTRRGATTIVRD